MKNLVIIFAILFVLSVIVLQLQQHVQAITGGFEPSNSYINALKNCTKGTFKDTNQSMITEYNIKGLLPNGRCDITITSYTDLSDPEDYKMAKDMIEGFVGMAESMSKDSGQKFDRSQIPSTDEILKMAQNEKYIMHCKFSKSERDMLYSAWQKHDGKNLPVQKSKDGSYSFSWDSSKMSSYENLMLKMRQGPCDSYSSSDKPTSQQKKYSCEYADTTCYWVDMGNGASSMQCTKENTDVNTFKLMDKVKGHVKAGYCEQI